MGVPNVFIDKCVKVGLSPSSLYHMFGNSIVTTMLIGVFGKLFNVKDYESRIRMMTSNILGNKEE